MADLIIKSLGVQNYQTCYAAMLQRTLERIDSKKNGQQTADELWLVQHPSVYTLGQAGKPEHILQATSTPVIQTDRGGQVTWHGEGQLVGYFLFDLNQLGWHVRLLVSTVETIVCQLLDPYLNQQYCVAKPRSDAPGVYVYHTHQQAMNNQYLGKIASLGFKIKHGFSYHGVAINVDADLTAFNVINPCGYQGMTMLNLANFTKVDMANIQQQFIALVQKYHANNPLKTGY